MLIYSLFPTGADIGEHFDQPTAQCWECYLARYGDLKAAFGDNLTAASGHWFDHGKHYEARNNNCSGSCSTPYFFLAAKPLSFSEAVATATEEGEDPASKWVNIWRNGNYLVDVCLGAVQQLAKKSARIWIRKVDDPTYGAKSRLFSWAINSMRRNCTPSKLLGGMENFEQLKFLELETEKWRRGLWADIEGVNRWPGTEVSSTFGEEKNRALTFLHSQVDWCDQRVVSLRSRKGPSKEMIAEGWEAPPHILEHLWGSAGTTSNGIRLHQPLVVWETKGGDGLKPESDWRDAESDDDTESEWGCKLPPCIHACMADDTYSEWYTDGYHLEGGNVASIHRNDRYYQYEYDFEARTQTRLRILNRDHSDCGTRFRNPQFRPRTVRPMRPLDSNVLYQATANWGGLHLGGGLCTFVYGEQQQVEVLLEYYPDDAALEQAEASAKSESFNEREMGVIRTKAAAPLAEEKKHWYRPEASMARGLHFKERKLWLDAMYEAKRTTRLHPAHLPAWLLLAELEYIVGRYNTCIATCSASGQFSGDLEDWKQKCESALQTISEQEKRGDRWAAADERAVNCPKDLGPLVALRGCDTCKNAKGCDSKGCDRNTGQGYEHLIEFANYLTEPFLEESQRHRVIWKWIESNRREHSPEGRYKHGGFPGGRAHMSLSALEDFKNDFMWCSGFTNLYHQMAAIVGLAGGSMSYANNHVWNTIVIDGIQYPQELTWHMWYEGCSEKLLRSACHNHIDDWRSEPWMKEPLPGGPNDWYLKPQPFEYMSKGEGEYMYQSPTQLPPSYAEWGIHHSPARNVESYMVGGKSVSGLYGRARDRSYLDFN